MFTASGTRPPFQLRVLIPKDTAWAKLSCPRRIPEKRALETIRIRDLREIVRKRK